MSIEPVDQVRRVPGNASPSRKLKPRQQHAAQLLAEGLGPIEVASRLHVSRQAVWRWQQIDEFLAFQDRCRAELHQARVDSFYALIDPAIDVAKESLEEGDPVMALGVLRLVAPSMTD